MRRLFVLLAVISAAWLVGCALPPTASDLALQRFQGGVDAVREATQRLQANSEAWTRAVEQAMVQWESFVEPLTGSQRDALAGVLVQNPTMASLDRLLAVLTPEQAQVFDEHMRTFQWHVSWSRQLDVESNQLREQGHALTRLGQETEAIIRAQYRDSAALSAVLLGVGQGLQSMSNTMQQRVYNDAVLWQLRSMNTNLRNLQLR